MRAALKRIAVALYASAFFAVGLAWGIADSPFPVSSGVSIGLADDLYVNEIGDTMTGALVMNTGGGTNMSISEVGFDKSSAITETVIVQNSGSGVSNLTVDGDISSISGVTYDWPNSQGGIGTVLLNNGAGILSWSSSPAASTISVLSSTFNCLAGVIVGEAVYINAVDNVAEADADIAAAAHPAIGFVASKPTGITCTVQLLGELGGFVGLTTGSVYFLSTTAGSITIFAPVGAGTLVQRLGVARNTTTLIINPGLEIIAN
jgi:hypothetical protein